MGLFREIKYIIKYFSAAKSATDVTFYSEGGIYYQYFKGTIEAIIKKSDIKILYITSDIQDPAWKLQGDQFESFYINKLLPFVFPFINTKTLILTMADLDHHHIKRSTNQVNHIYMFHAINSVHMTYNEGAFDHYDTIFCVGPHHESEIRKTEEVYQLEPKRLIQVGYSWLEELETQYLERASSTIHEREKILIAPSWNAENILETCIDTILDKILVLDYDIIVRPHPEYIKRQGLAIKQLHDKYSHHSNFILDTNSASSESVQGSFLLITDWSGIGIEYAWGMGKPVIYINTPKKIHNLEYKKLNIVPLEVRIRNIIGKVIAPSDCSGIDCEIQKIMNNSETDKETLQYERNDNIFNWGRSGEVGADYIINYCLENNSSRKLKN